MGYAMSVLLTYKELAARVRLSVPMLRKMLADGRFGPAPVRFGRAVRFNPDEVSAWLAAGAPDRRSWEKQRAGARP